MEGKWRRKNHHLVCQNCGYKSAKYLGRCPNCGEWSSFVEEVEVQEVKNQRVSMTGERSKPLKLDEVEYLILLGLKRT